MTMMRNDHTHFLLFIRSESNILLQCFLTRLWYTYTLQFKLRAQRCLTAQWTRISARIKVKGIVRDSVAVKKTLWSTADCTFQYSESADKRIAHAQCYIPHLFQISGHYNFAHAQSSFWLSISGNYNFHHPCYDSHVTSFWPMTCQYLHRPCNIW